ncbi:hypothetical protein MED01_004261 [Micromonospora sp. MED01]|uniref:hypothetical protein n=1 Tax=Micromonospora alfalfae TaxID=2911212 RepID=UPI001EE7D054|nr:hypothetical protein [Micromonospora alfalfae]MCG5460835.1 hypothetical protein [Micromonospora alfalfae]
MSDLMHWHGQPSALAEPPACCQHVFSKAEDRAVREAVHDTEAHELDERRRFILAALANIEAYRDGMATVLTPEQMELAARVSGHCADLVRKSACTCPDIEVSTLGEGEGARFVKGLDARCGLHGALASAPA